MSRILRYLIVEDDAASVLITKWELVSKGFVIEFQQAENEAEMCQRLLKHRFDFIISDQCMPAFSAREALRLRNKIAPEVPFIILSSHITEEVRQAAVKENCSTVLLKENIEQLADIVTRLLPEDIPSI